MVGWIRPATHEKLPDLSGHRLIARRGLKKMMTAAIGPSPADVDNQSVVLAAGRSLSESSPSNGPTPSRTFSTEYGEESPVLSSPDPVWLKQVAWTDEHDCHVTVKLQVRPFFDADTAVISP